MLGSTVGFLAALRFLRYRCLYTRTAVARLPLRQLGFLVCVCYVRLSKPTILPSFIIRRYGGIFEFGKTALSSRPECFHWYNLRQSPPHRFVSAVCSLLSPILRVYSYRLIELICSVLKVKLCGDLLYVAAAAAAETIDVRFNRHRKQIQVCYSHW